MPTNILSLTPHRRQDFVTSTNSDWTEGWAFVRSGSPVAVRDPGNANTAVLSALSAQPTTPRGHYRIAITGFDDGATVYAVSDPLGQEIGRGVVGAPYQVQGITFTVGFGTPAYKVGDGFTLSVLAAPIDLTGIEFTAMLRRTDATGAVPLRATVDLSLATDALIPNLLSGGPGGVVSAYVLQPRMQALAPGFYAYDLIARADGREIRAFYGTVRHDLGVTRLSA